MRARNAEAFAVLVGAGRATSFGGGADGNRDAKDQGE
jgi:hypothetical protein